MAEPDQMYGQHVAEKMKKKPEFSFLITQYALLYQSIIPNPTLTIATLCQHFSIDENVMKYICSGSCHRIQCQRILNVLLVDLENGRDYMQFCYYFSTISVLTDLPFKLIAVFHNNGCWDKDIPLHPKLSLHESTTQSQLIEKGSQNLKLIMNIPGAQSTANTNIASSTFDPLEWCAKDNFIFKSLTEENVESIALVDSATSCSVSTYYQINDRRRLHAPSVATQSIGMEDDTTSHTTFALASTLLQTSSSTPAINSISVAHSEDKTSSSSIVVSTTESHMDVQHTGSLTDLTGVTTTCTSTHISSTVNTNTVTNTNLSTVPLDNIQLIRSKYASILQCLPNDYGKTLQAVQDHFTDEEICVVLSSSDCNSANRTILDFLVQKASNTENLLQFCEQLEKIMSLLNDPEVLGNIIREFKTSFQQTIVSTATNSNQFMLHNQENNQLLQPDIHLVRSKFDDILQCLPIEYEKTLQVVQDHLTDEHICIVLSNSDHSSANKAILNCLLDHAGSLLEFCDQVEKILPLSTNQRLLANIIAEIRTRLQQNIKFADNNSNSAPLSASNEPIHIRPPKAGDLYNHVFSTIHLNSQALMLMKLNYTRLCDCLPQDYMRTIQLLMEYLETPEEAMRQLTMMQSVELVNENIVGNLMLAVLQSDKDILKFCNIIEEVLSTTKGKKFIQALRNQLLKTLDPTCIPVVPTITMTTSGPLFSNNSANLSYTESHMDSVTHETSHRPLKETATTSVTGNLQLQHPADDITRDRESQPQIAELYHDVVPKYAIYWEDLGIKLGLKDHHIDVISQNNAFNPNRMVDCCKSMLKKWLQIDSGATWGKLRDAINLVSKKGKYMNPPKLPVTFISRPDLLEEMANKICSTSLNLDCYMTTLTVTGAGGFGKTTLVTALCYHPTIQSQFTNGFVLVELGPQASDPSVKLSQLYHLLTGKYLKPGDANYAEQEINQLIANYYQNLLVIIDDVWHVEDAEPIVKAFSHCKIVLTTRMNDIEEFIPTNERVTVGPMEPNEAVRLLTSGVIDFNKISDEDMKLLDNLAQEVHLWPLILALIRGQLFHNLKHFNLSHHEAIETVQAKLHNNGLTAFDKNNIESVNRSRKFAVKICIEITLKLLSQREAENFRSLVLATGVGNSLPTKALHYLWNVSEKEAKDKVDNLWAYGIVRFTNNIIPPYNKMQHCVEVHAVISQYIFENLDGEQVFRLSPYGGLGTAQILKHGLELLFQQAYGVRDVSSLTPIEYLKYTQSKIECDLLPYYYKKIDMRRIYEVHFIKKKIQQMQGILMSSVNIISVVSLFNEQVSPIISECDKLSNQIYMLSRELKQTVERYLNEQNYDRLIEAIENNCYNSSIGLLAQKVVNIIKNFISYCEPQHFNVIIKYCEYLQKITPDYNMVSHKLMPYIKLHIELHHKIRDALQRGSPQIEATYHYCTAGKYEEEFDLVHTNFLIKLQGVASSLVH